MRGERGKNEGKEEGDGSGVRVVGLGRRLAPEQLQKVRRAKRCEEDVGGYDSKAGLLELLEINGCSK